MGRLMTGSLSDANLCEMGRVSAARTIEQTALATSQPAAAHATAKAGLAKLGIPARQSSAACRGASEQPAAQHACLLAQRAIQQPLNAVEEALAQLHDPCLSQVIDSIWR